MLADPRWPETYVRFELLLLQELGFALDLDRCAVTGATDDLAYVSPRTGRAVSRARCRRSGRTAAAAAGRSWSPMFLLRSADVRGWACGSSGHFLRQAPVRARPTAPCPPPASA